MLFYVAFYKLDVVALRQEVLAVYTAGAPPLNIRELSQHSRALSTFENFRDRMPSGAVRGEGRGMSD